MKQVVADLWDSGYFFDYRNYLTLIASLALLAYPVLAFFLEFLAGKGLPQLVLNLIIFIYLTALLAYPILMIQWIESAPLMGAYLMMFTVGQFLKLVSFHHVMADNRYLMQRVAQVKK